MQKQDEPKKRSKVVLIIDDDEFNRRLIQKVAENAGFSVLECSSLTLGLETAKKALPDVIVLDLVMGGESGFDLEKQKKIPDIEKIPVMVVSSLKDGGSIKKAISMGASDYLIKPLDPLIFIKKLDKIASELRSAKVTFPPASLPKVRVSGVGKILRGAKGGFLLETPFVIAPKTQLIIQSPILDDLQCADSVFQRTDTPARAGFPGRFQHDVLVVGLSAAAVKRIHQAEKSKK